MDMVAGKYQDLFEKYLTEVYGPGHISYIHDDCVGGAMQFAEWLDKELEKDGHN